MSFPEADQREAEAPKIWVFENSGQIALEQVVFWTSPKSEKRKKVSLFSSFTLTWEWRNEKRTEPFWAFETCGRIAIEQVSRVKNGKNWQKTDSREIKRIAWKKRIAVRKNGLKRVDFKMEVNDFLWKLWRVYIVFAKNVWKSLSKFEKNPRKKLPLCIRKPQTLVRLG